MVKYFCDVCGIEVVNPASSLDMTGKVLCNKHYAEHMDACCENLYILTSGSLVCADCNIDYPSCKNCNGV